MKQFLVLTRRTPQFQPAVVEEHFTFLEGLRAKGQLGLSGAFTDKSGGAYILLANDLEEAERIAFADPLSTSQSSEITVHEWIAK